MRAIPARPVGQPDEAAEIKQKQEMMHELHRYNIYVYKPAPTAEPSFQQMDMAIGNTAKPMKLPMARVRLGLM